MESGIYKISNPLNNKIYIGSSININRRWERHKNTLKRGVHPNIHLQRSFDKLIKVNENFIYELLELCDVNILIQKEQFYIDTLNPEYNIAKVANSSKGIVRRKSTKEKIKNSLLGTKQSKETVNKRKLALIGQTRTKEQRATMAISKLGLNNPIFKIGWNKQVEAMRLANTGKKRSKEVGLKISEKLSKPVIQLTLENIFIKEWSSAVQVQKKLGFANGDINQVCSQRKTSRGIRRSAYGYKWKFKIDYDNEKNNN